MIQKSVLTSKAVPEGIKFKSLYCFNHRNSLLAPLSVKTKILMVCNTAAGDFWAYFGISILWLPRLCCSFYLCGGLGHRQNHSRGRSSSARHATARESPQNSLPTLPAPSGWPTTPAVPAGLLPPSSSWVLLHCSVWHCPLLSWLLLTFHQLRLAGVHPALSSLIQLEFAWHFLVPALLLRETNPVTGQRKGLLKRCLNTCPVFSLPRYEPQTPLFSFNQVHLFPCSFTAIQPSSYHSYCKNSHTSNPKMCLIWWCRWATLHIPKQVKCQFQLNCKISSYY